ncbi:MAG: SDR family NAD(P)-dependent oxidoreductase [Candidatus Promineifilaceae bacterium]|nr:SDR family NAD(P)-dependent oxidoreductase [Candidatus Promineifilaceae bacterium]
MSTINLNHNPSTDRRVALVTGATGAIGRAIARQLAKRTDFAVALLGRDESRTQDAAASIRQTSGNQQVGYVLADLSRRHEIYALAERWEGPLHVLINNAAATPRQRQETPEGIELQFATNVLGYFWMTRAFRDILAASAPARIVNVASYYAGDLELDDLEFERRTYDNRRAYRQSKQANRMLTAAFAQRLADDNIAVNACHPGDVNSKLSNNLGFGGSESPDQGADTPVWLATSPEGGEKTGRYFANRRERRDPFTQDADAVEALYQACLAYETA